ncbi:MAG: type I restriction enzyme HsdR N-terminal domain-containing protein [Cyanobacteria bacterium P01_F01_bin.4]
MVQTIAVTDAIVNLNEVHQRFGLQLNSTTRFFTEWQQSLPALTQTETAALNRYRDRYLFYTAEGSISEGTVNIIMVSPLLELLGLCDPPHKILGERYVTLAIDNGETLLKGRIDVLILQENVWIVLIEAKHFGFSVMQALPQTLTYMMASPKSADPLFAMITTGEDFLFLKLQRQTSEYALSHKFTLLSDESHNLHQAVRILKRLTFSE